MDGIHSGYRQRLDFVGRESSQTRRTPLVSTSAIDASCKGFIKPR